MMPMPMATFLPPFVSSALSATASALMSPKKSPTAQLIIGQPASKFVWMATEVWADVSGFIERPQLARSVSLTNRLLHKLCWPRMHGNRVVLYEIRGLRIECGEPFDSCRPAKAILLKDDGREVPFPNCPAPDYISGFGQITISFLDHQLLEFLTFISARLNEVFLSLYWIKLNAKQTATVNELLHIFKEQFPHTIFSVECKMASVSYLRDLDFGQPNAEFFI